MKRRRRLWATIGGQPWLVAGPVPRGRKGEPFFARGKGKASRFLDNPPVPFSRLTDKDLLDTSDLLRLFECSKPTLYRCIYGRGLAPVRRHSGRGVVMYFRKGEVLKWLKSNPWPGRKGSPPWWEDR
jgi:hypothetical protein